MGNWCTGRVALPQEVTQGPSEKGAQNDKEQAVNRAIAQAGETLRASDPNWRELQDVQQGIVEGAQGVVSGLLEASAAGETFGQTMSKALLNVTNQLLNLIAQLAIINPALNSIGFGGGGLPTLAGVFAAAAGPSTGGSAGTLAALALGGGRAAYGGVWDRGYRLHAFAKGGVVDGPTTFPMAWGHAGLMGEAGPEAVLPLHRGADGKLGVAANLSGEGDTYVTVNIATGVQATVRAEVMNLLPQISHVTTQAVANAKARNKRGTRILGKG